MDAIVVRSISREYRIRTRSAKLAELLAFIEARPQIEGPALAPVDIAVEETDHGFRLQLPDGERIEPSFIEAANRIHEASSPPSWRRLRERRWCMALVLCSKANASS